MIETAESVYVWVGTTWVKFKKSETDTPGSVMSRVEEIMRAWGVLAEA